MARKKPEWNFVSYSVFVSFIILLVGGSIEFYFIDFCTYILFKLWPGSIY